MENEISRRRFAGLAAGLSQAAPGAANRPNILLLLTDQQRWDSIAGRTQCRTPNINRLAREGMKFERPYTAAAVCCPSRASLLTGQYSYHSGVFNQINGASAVRRAPFAGVASYAQRIKEAGYRLGYLGKWHVSWEHTPLDFGFDEIGAPGSYNPATLKGVKLFRAAGDPPPAKRKIELTGTLLYPGGMLHENWGIDHGPPESTGAWNIARHAVAMIEQFAGASRPWFITTNMNEPHNPFTPRPEFLRHYHPDDMPLPRGFNETFENKPDMHRREASLYASVTEKDARVGVAHYYAYCEQLDVEIGRILDALEKTGQAGNTLVVFATDHGELCGDHHMYLKGWMPYEGCYRIPMAARWPGRITPGSTCSKIVMLPDLAHTFVEVAGGRPIQTNDARSLVPLFSNPETPDWLDEALTVWHGAEFLYSQRMLIRQRYKFVFNGFAMDELYDLEKDPDEIHNVAGDPAYRSALEEMQERLYMAMERCGDSLAFEKMGADRYLYRPSRFKQKGTQSR